MAMVILAVFAAVHVLAVLVVMWFLIVGDRTGMLGWSRDDETGGGTAGGGGPVIAPEPPAPPRPRSALRTVPFPVTGAVAGTMHPHGTGSRPATASRS